MKLVLKKFTLVELLVSMAVFSVILVIAMQLFSGMRQVWQGSEEKNKIYGNARVVMDMMTSMLQTIYFSPDDVGDFYFRIDKGATNENSKIYFATKTNYTLPGTHPVRFVAFFVPKNPDVDDFKNTLMLTVVSNAAKEIDEFNDAENKFSFWFPAYFPAPGVAGEDKFNAKRDRLYNILDTEKIKSGAQEYCRNELLKNVVSFKIKGINKDGNEISTNPIDDIPEYIDINLQILPKVKFEQWQSMADSPASAQKLKKEFLNKNKFEFYRRVHIGSR